MNIAHVNVNKIYQERVTWCAGWVKHEYTRYKIAHNYQ